MDSVPTDTDSQASRGQAIPVAPLVERTHSWYPPRRPRGRVVLPAVDTARRAEPWLTPKCSPISVSVIPLS